MVSAIELREIRVFLVLAEELHYGHTAERLEQTTSRVSQVIRTLEARIGVRLFDRTSRRVALTAAGEQLRERLQPTYAELLAVLEQAHDDARGISGVLRIGSYHPAMVRGPAMVEAVKMFEADHPAVSVEFVDTGWVRDYFGWLRGGEVDMLATRLPVSDPDMEVGPVIGSESRVLAVAADHPLAGRGSVGVEDLAEYTVSDTAGLPREMMDAFVPPRTPSGRPLKRIQHRTWLETVMRIVVGEIVHPTVPAFLDHAGSHGIVGVPISDLPPSQTVLVWLAANRAARVAAFARAVSQTVGAAEGNGSAAPAPR